MVTHVIANLPDVKRVGIDRFDSQAGKVIPRLGSVSFLIQFIGNAP